MIFGSAKLARYYLNLLRGSSFNSRVKARLVLSDFENENAPRTSPEIVTLFAYPEIWNCCLIKG